MSFIDGNMASMLHCKKQPKKNEIETQGYFNPNYIYTQSVFKWMAELALSSNHPDLVLFQQ